MRKSFKAFTLVEMLIVMGIIIILMAVGITAGRYAINRANDVTHQNAVDNIYTALQAFYVDNREFPDSATQGLTFTELISGTGVNSLADYMDDGAFDGGTEATYFYVSDSLNQVVLVCVSLFGPATNTLPGDFYCNGNGFGSDDIFSGAITDKIIDRDDTDLDQSPADAAFPVVQLWDGDDWQ